MEKKIVKVNVETHEKVENRKDRGDSPRRIKERLTRINPVNANNANKRFLHDRGDSRKAKIEEPQIQYDATKINKASEANAKLIKQAYTQINKNGLKSNTNNTVSAECESKSYSCFDSKVTDGRQTIGKKILQKQPSLHQTSGVRNVGDPTNKAKEIARNRTKFKEVITIPYTPADDLTVVEIDDDPLEVGPETKAKNSITKPAKEVKFKDNDERPLNPGLNGKNHPKRPSNPGSITSCKARKRPKCKRRKKASSPSPIKGAVNDCQPTEVVKWSPSSVNNHTRPYYEAWVDTSLTAVSKCSEKERLRLEREMIETLREWKRPVSPELIYDRSNDESYTGRIRIRRG